MSKLNIFLQNISLKKEIFTRFPLVFIFIILAIFFALSYSNEIYYFSKIFDENLILMFIISIISMTSLSLFFESRKNSFFTKFVLFIFILSLSYIAIFYFKSLLILFFIATILSLCFSNFLLISSTNKEFLNFNLKVLYALSFAFIGSFILGFGIFIILTSIEYLFNIKFFKEYLEEINIIITLGVFPSLVLSNIQKNTSDEKLEIHSSFSILINNILIPMMLIYSFILYSYFIKIIILQELPKGSLTWMISFYLSFGLILKILLLAIKNKSNFSRFYDKFYYFLTLFPLAFLYLAIYIRVSQYGITIFRYLIIALALWFTFVSLANLAKKNFNFKYLFIFLFLITLFASISPYNAKIVSINSQISRLKKILISNNILQNEKVISGEKELKLKDRIQLSSIISYLIYDELGKEKITALLKKDFKNQNDVLKYLNVEYTKKYKKISFDYNIKNTAYEIEGYKYILTISLNTENQKNYTYTQNKKIKASFKNSILSLNIDQEEITFDLKALVKKLKKEKLTKIYAKDLIKVALIKKIKLEKIKLQLTFLDMDNDDNIKYIEAILLL